MVSIFQAYEDMVDGVLDRKDLGIAKDAFVCWNGWTNKSTKSTQMCL